MHTHNTELVSMQVSVAGFIYALIIQNIIKKLIKNKKIILILLNKINKKTKKLLTLFSLLFCFFQIKQT